jgi:hypothetical protein
MIPTHPNAEAGRTARKSDRSDFDHPPRPTGSLRAQSALRQQNPAARNGHLDIPIECVAILGED